MQMFSVKVKIIIPVSQVAKDLTNHEYDAIIVRSFSIMDMNVKEKKINEISKVKISKATPTLPLKQCLWNSSLLECNILQESPCDIWYLDLGCTNHITRNLEICFLVWINHFKLMSH